MNNIIKNNKQNNNTPFISVVVPLYNKQDQIEFTISSILKQNFENFEIIVVDDGSQDNSVNIVKKISDKRIKLIHRENGGDGAARNTGVRESRGSLIAFIDADDQWMPNFLDEIIILNSKFPDAGMFATGFRIKYQNNYSIDIFVESGEKNSHHVHINDYFKHSIKRGFITSSNVAIIRSAFDEVGYFYEKVGASCDRDMWARVAMKYKVVCSSKILAIYNCEQTNGRVSLTKRKTPPRPAFSLTLRNIIEKNGGISSIDQNLVEYANFQWFDRVDKSILSGNIDEAKRILKNEIIISDKILLKFRWFMLLILLLPLPMAQFIRKFQKSRWVQPLSMISYNRSFPKISQKVTYTKTKNEKYF